MKLRDLAEEGRTSASEIYYEEHGAYHNYVPEPSSLWKLYQKQLILRESWRSNILCKRSRPGVPDAHEFHLRWPFTAAPR